MKSIPNHIGLECAFVRIINENMENHVLPSHFCTNLKEITKKSLSEGCTYQMLAYALIKTFPRVIIRFESVFLIPLKYTFFT